MELIRLRKHLREHQAEPGYGAMQVVMDIMDDLHLALEEMEDYIKDGMEAHYVDGESCKDYAHNQVREMVGVLAMHDDFGYDFLLRKLCEYTSIGMVDDTLKAYKKEVTEIFSQEDSLGDLDDHPF